MCGSSPDAEAVTGPDRLSPGHAGAQKPDEQRQDEQEQREDRAAVRIALSGRGSFRSRHTLTIGTVTLKRT